MIGDERAVSVELLEEHGAIRCIEIDKTHRPPSIPVAQCGNGGLDVICRRCQSQGEQLIATTDRQNKRVRAMHRQPIDGHAERPALPDDKLRQIIQPDRTFPPPPGHRAE